MRHPKIPDAISDCLIVGVRELLQEPFVVIGVDYQQVAPIGGGTVGQDLCSTIQTIELIVVDRTDDPKLLEFLFTARAKQPSRSSM